MPFNALAGNPNVGDIPAVGKGVSVLVGVNNSAPRAVTVGVNVSGVLVEVAKRFCVGIGVALENGVDVSAGGGGVGDVISCPTFCKAVQPERKIDSRRR